MSTPQTTTNGHGAEPAACPHCGEALLPAGRFCPGCGRPAGDGAHGSDTALGAGDASAQGDSPAADPTEEPTVVHRHPAASSPPRADPKRPPGARRPGGAGGIAALVAAVVVVVVVAAAAAFLLLSGSDDENSAPAYKQKVAAAFGPVLGANRQVSDQLARLRGTNVRSARAGDARVAVRRAQQAVTLATGAVGALNAPASSDQLARDARQALDRESAYYGEVARVLARPASTSTANLSDLASNLTSALSVAGPTVAGAEPTVSGTDRLVAWARTIRVRAQRAAAARRNRNSDNRRTPAPADNSGGGSSQPPRTTDCGGGVIAGPNTSCSFALNVRDAWLDAPGTTNTVRVFSPVTNETYTMSCSPSGRGVSCSGGNNASVTFGG